MSMEEVVKSTNHGKMRKISTCDYIFHLDFYLPARNFYLKKKKIS